MTRRHVLPLLLLALPAFAWAAPANMSGHWVLNQKASQWNKKKPPQNITIDIQHNDPKFKYDGTLQQDDEGQTSQFHFDGAIDNKEYTTKQDQVERKIVVKRKNDMSIESTATSMDGKSVETSTTSISRDGKRLTRRITLKAPEGSATWTEVYDKQ